MKNLITGTIAAIAVAGLMASRALAQESGADAAAGKALWEGSQTQCRTCHGKAGEGAFGPPLSGRGLSAAEFQHAARKPWGIMPAFTGDQVSDADLANFAAYFASLPKVAEPGAWRFPVPDDGRVGQRTAISLGCAQCHGATFDVARGILGGRVVGFDQFKDLVYHHTIAMPKLGIAEGNTPGERLHMGNYDPLRISEQQLRTIYDWAKNDLGFRPYLEARLTASGATYSLKLENDGLKGKGPAAQEVVIDIALPQGVTVVGATGEGYKGVKSDPAAQDPSAEWRLARLSPDEARSFTVTLSSPVPGVKGTVRWAKPAPKSGAKFDSMNFAAR